MASLPLPAAPAQTPSQIHRFLSQVGDYRNAERTFTSVEYACFFGLTASEAQTALNGLALLSLVRFEAVVDEVETWGLTKDGYSVLGYLVHAHRMPKKDRTRVILALQQLSPPLAEMGVSEISIGGRVMDGSVTGDLLIGIRLSGEPSKPTVARLAIERLRADLTPVLPNPISIAILPFRQLIPERLRRRWVVTPTGLNGPLDASDLEIDENEALVTQEVLSVLGMSLEEFRAAASAWGWDASNPPGTAARHYLHECRGALLLPCNGVSSTLALRDAEPLSPEVVSASDSPRSVFEPAWHGYHRDQLYLLDYLLARGQGAAQFSARARRVVGGLSEDHRLAKADAQQLLQRLWLQLREDRVRAQGGARANRQYKRPMLSHVAVFDCLSEDEPVFFGFARISGTRATGFTEIRQLVSDSAHRRGSPISRALRPLELSVGWLSTFFRPATAEEELALAGLNEAHEMAFKSVTPDPANPGFGIGSAARRAYELVRLGKLPPVLAAPSAAGLLPRYYSTRAFRATAYGLQAVLAECPTLATRIGRWHLDADVTPMPEFITRSQSEPESPAVQAAHLHPAWALAFCDDGWTAASAVGEWRVELTGSETQLRLAVAGPNFASSKPLWPNSAKSRYVEDCYGGQLGDVLTLLHKLDLHRHVDPERPDCSPVAGIERAVNMGWDIEGEDPRIRWAFVDFAG